MSETVDAAWEASLRETLTTYAPLVKRDGYLNVDALMVTLRPFIRAEADERVAALREAARRYVGAFHPDKRQVGDVDWEPCACVVHEHLRLILSDAGPEDAR